MVSMSNRRGALAALFSCDSDFIVVHLWLLMPLYSAFIALHTDQVPVVNPTLTRLLADYLVDFLSSFGFFAVLLYFLQYSAYIVVEQTLLFPRNAVLLEDPATTP